MTKENLKRVLREAAWAPLAVLIAHVIAGELFGYEPYVDPVMHFLGGAAVAYFFYKSLIIVRPSEGYASRMLALAVPFSLACNAALFWEFGEFAADRAFGTNVQRDLMNAMRDLILGVTGATPVPAAVFAILQRGVGRRDLAVEDDRS